MTFNKFLPHNSIHLLAKHGKKFRLIFCVCVIVVPSLILYMTSVLSAFSLSIYVLLKAFFRVLFRRIKWILGNSYTFTHTHTPSKCLSCLFFISSFCIFYINNVFTSRYVVANNKQTRRFLCFMYLCSSI